MTNKQLLKYYLVICLPLVFIVQESFSQIVVDETPRGLYYSRTHRVKKFKDMKDFRDVFHYDKFLLGRNRVMGNISYNFQRVLVDNGFDRHHVYRHALGFFTRIRFWEEFSFNSNFFIDFNKDAKARWISDYTYSIGRYNWRPNRLNFGFENYTNHKYNDNMDLFLQKVTEGWFFVSYNLILSPRHDAFFRLDSTTQLKIVPFLRFSPRYRDENEVVHYEGKPAAGLSARVTLFWNIYAEGAVYYYGTPYFTQLPWDPDYTYGFGYFDWRSFRISLTYGNWAINRFPGKKQYYKDYGFLDGNFKVVANWIW